MDAIVAEDVRRRYGATVALDGVSLAVGRGEVFALVGPNGAGKTTLVRALTGTTNANGRVKILGDSPQTVSRERIGLLPQDFQPPERLTAHELFDYFAGLYDEPREPDNLLNIVGLTNAADTRYEHLSGGQQRRVCIGTALVNDPDVLFLDEPTTGVDPAGRRSLWEVLDELAAAGTTIFLTTHNMTEAERLADRVGLLSEGSLLAVDTPAELIGSYGGDTLLQVSTDAESVPDLDYEAHLSEGRLIVYDVPATDVGKIVDTLEMTGVKYGDLTWTQPNLEDVYLALAEGGKRGGGPS